MGDLVQRECRAALIQALGVAGLVTTLIGGCHRSPSSQLPREEIGRVVEASMVPHFLGEHLVVQCRHCRAEYRLPVGPSEGDTRSTCPHCGHLHHPQSVNVGLGDRLLIKANDGPVRRWQTVAFRDPRQESRTCIKRVVGLPGEQIDIRDGEVYIDGLPYRKTFAEYRMLAVNVIDTRSSELSLADACWEREDLHWDPGNGGLRLSSDRRDKAAWLQFRGRPFPGYDQSPGIVFDDYIFNQRVSRRLHPMRDVTVMVEAASHAPTAELHIQMEWAAETGVDSWRLVVAPHARRAYVRRRDVLVEAISLATWGDPEMPAVGFGCVDGQIVVTDGKTEMWQSVDEILPNCPLVSLQVGALDPRGKGLTISRLTVARDIFYLGSRGPALPTRLAGDEVYVLGDNCPVSEDSRQFGPLAVEQMVGLAVQAGSRTPE